jgi:hypothetical protein
MSEKKGNTMEETASVLGKIVHKGVQKMRCQGVMAPVEEALVGGARALAGLSQMISCPPFSVW